MFVYTSKYMMFVYTGKYVMFVSVSNDYKCQNVCQESYTSIWIMGDNSSNLM